MNKLEDLDPYVDAEGFFDLKCRKCSEILFVFQFNIDGSRIKIICSNPRCRNEKIVRLWEAVP